MTVTILSIIILIGLAAYSFIRSLQIYPKEGDTKYSQRVSFVVSCMFAAVSVFAASRAYYSIREILQ